MVVETLVEMPEEIVEMTFSVGDHKPLEWEVVAAVAWEVVTTAIITITKVEDLPMTMVTLEETTLVA